MAHEIDMSNGRANAAFAKTGAWHGLGKVLPGYMTGNEILTEAGLDWRVDLVPTLYTKADGSLSAIKDRKTVVRDDTQEALGIVGSQFVPLQNKEFASWMDGITANGAKFESAGSLFGGKRIWALANVAASFEVLPGDWVNTYILLSNSHDGSLKFRFLPTSVRVVCNNTFTAASSAEGGFSIRHDSSMTRKLEEAQRLLAVANDWAGRQQTESKALLKGMGPREFAEFMEGFLRKIPEGAPRGTMQKGILKSMESPENNLPGMAGTAWQVYNAVSEWIDHSGRMSPENKLVNVTMGYGARLKRAAWNQLLLAV